MDGRHRALNLFSTCGSKRSFAFLLSSCRNGIVNPASSANERVSSSGLQGSLRGLLPEIWFLVLSSTYLQFEDTKDKELVIDPESAGRDLERMSNMANEFFGVWLKLLCDIHGERCNHAKAKRILKTLQDRPHYLPAFIYMALHSEPSDSNQEPGYMAADYPKDCPNPKRGVIRDSEIRKSLLIPGSGPLLLVLEACNSSNILELPFCLECIGGEVRHQETEYFGKYDWTLDHPRIQICATTPDHKAIWFPSTGGLFTQAFYNLFRRADLSLQNFLKEMQELVDKQILAAGVKDQNGNPLSQRLRIYFSGVNHPDENIWSILGFTLKPPLGE